MAEQMTFYEFCELQAQALIEREDMGRLHPRTLATLEKIKAGEIEVMDQGWVRPLDDAR